MTDVKTLIAILPQTQCRQCGFDGCDAYATAIAEGKAPINRCAPGGQKGIVRLAKALGIPPMPLDADYGHEMPLALARIRPEACIGCALCVRACPVDAITGLPKHLFSVLSNRCTGCALCVPVCPVDAIGLEATHRLWSEEDASNARHAFLAKRERERERKAELEALRQSSQKEKRTLIEALIQRVRNGETP